MPFVFLWEKKPANILCPNTHDRVIKQLCSTCIVIIFAPCILRTNPIISTLFEFSFYSVLIVLVLHTNALASFYKDNKTLLRKQNTLDVGSPTEESISPHFCCLL